MNENDIYQALRIINTLRKEEEILRDKQDYRSRSFNLMNGIAQGLGLAAHVLEEAIVGNVEYLYQLETEGYN